MAWDHHLHGDFLGQGVVRSRTAATILTDMLLSAPGVTLDELAHARTRISLHMQERINDATAWAEAAMPSRHGD